jgi:hypothetical protein
MLRTGKTRLGDDFVSKLARRNATLKKAINELHAAANGNRGDKEGLDF